MIVSSKSDKKDKVIDILIYALMILVAIATIYPFLNILAISFNDSADSIKGGITIFPRKFTLVNYNTIFKYDTLLQGFKISVARTVLGTFAGVVCSSMLAYALSRVDFIAKKGFSIYFVITMYVSGGLIPGYILIASLGLTDTFLVYIVPSLISVFNVVIIRSFIDSLPISLQESAMIDGANDILIFFKIIMPLCTPVLATVALFVAVGQWNSWFDTYLFCSNSPDLTTLQFELMKILQNTTTSATDVSRLLSDSSLQQRARVSPESIRMTVTVVATVPILVVYPFVQKYFVQGMTLGAVKS